jgi:hypothetical protein
VQYTGKRSTPDVAFDGDPNTGVLVYQTSLDTGLGSWATVGGTSLGAPAWAAIIAIVDQGRRLSGKGSLDGATQTLPAIYAGPPSDFNAVTAVVRRGQVSVAAASNTSTGRGTPIGQALVTQLVAYNGSTGPTINTKLARAIPKATLARRRKPTAAVVGQRQGLVTLRPTDRRATIPAFSPATSARRGPADLTC